MDVTTAFLNGDLDGEIYMKQPEGFASEGQAHLVCKLKKSIYGLKQAPRCWNTVLDVQLKKMGFSQSTSDPCIYKSANEEPFLIAVYVDDIILAGRTDKRIGEVKEALKEAFKVKDMGALHYFLGVAIKQDHEGGKIWIGQSMEWKMPSQLTLQLMLTTNYWQPPKRVSWSIRDFINLQLEVSFICHAGRDRM